MRRWMLPIIVILGTLVGASVRALPAKWLLPLGDQNSPSVHKIQAPQSIKGWIVDAANLPPSLSVGQTVELKIESLGKTEVRIQNERQSSFYKDIVDGGARRIPVYVETYGDVLVLSSVPWVGVPVIKDLGGDTYEVRIGSSPKPAVLKTVVHDKPGDAPGDLVYPFANEMLATLRDAQIAQRSVLAVVDFAQVAFNIARVCLRSEKIKCVGD